MIEWTEAHAREAAARIFDLAARIATDHVYETRSSGALDRAYTLVLVSGGPLSETTFREALAAGGFGDRRIEREVLRVDRLAAGDLWRMVEYHVRTPNGNRWKRASLAEARKVARPGDRVVRVTRIGPSGVTRQELAAGDPSHEPSDEDSGSE